MRPITERLAGGLHALFEGPKEEGSTARIPFADNVKGLAIILVVVGHWLSHYTGLEGETLHASAVLYGIVYSIHMPAFALVTGYLAKGDGWTARGIRTTAWLIGVYLAASCVHSAIRFLFYAEPGQLVGLEHLLGWMGGYPPYSLWWLVSLAIWRTVLPLVQRVKRAFGSWGPILFASLMLVVLCEFSLENGSWLSMMRTVYFWPFFLMGHIIRDCKASTMSKSNLEKGRIVGLAGFAAVAALVGFGLSAWTTDEIYELAGIFLYGSNPVWVFDKPLDFLAVNLLLFYSASVAFSLLLAVAIPKRACFLTPVGRYSLNVYLVHVVVLLIVSSPAVSQTGWGACLTDFIPLTLLGIAIVALCSAGPFAKWLDAMLRKLKCKGPSEEK